jgi:hypothetical protein
MKIIPETASRAARPVRVDGPGKGAPRERVFDLLRTFGLFSILLAHVDPPVWLWLLRDFDVPLLVLVSGAVCQLGYRGRPIVYGSYIRKRVLRLLVPVYVFLVGYFLVAETFAPARFDADVIGRTFLLLNGMGYVWIIRVFLLVALVTPFLLRLRQRVRPIPYFLILLGGYLAHEGLWALFSRGGEFSGWEGIKFSVFYALPYGCLFGLGLRWPGMSRRAAFAWAAAGLGLATLMLVALRAWPDPSVAAALKYPPRLAYFWYGLGMSHLLYGICLHGPRMAPRIENLIAWISASSLWIYLWHIPGLQVARKIISRIDLGDTSFAGMWVLTAAFAMGVTLFQQRVVGAVVRRGRWGERTRRALEMAFLN